MLAWLSKRLQLEPDEGRRAFTLAVALFGLIGSYTLVKTARDAYFLAELPAGLLPYVFIGVGVLTALVSALLGKFLDRRSTSESLAVSSLLAALTLAAFIQAARTHASWVPIAFYLWVNVYGLILIAQFWAYANSISHAREAKRTFSVVGVGAILGGLVAGLIATPLAQAGALATLVTVAAVTLLLVALWVWRVSRSDRITPPEPAPAAEEPNLKPIKHPYVRWLALATLCGVMVTSVLDYQFKVELQRRYSTGNDIAAFLGLYYTAINLAALTLQLFGTRWLIQRFGASWSAALQPAGLAIGSALTLAVPGFVAVSLTRIWDQVLRLSVTKSANELFYFPLAPGLRRRAKAMIEAAIERLGDGFAGVVILLAAATIGAGTRALAAVVLVLVGLWVVAWMRVRVGYVAELGRNLRRFEMDDRGTSISLREASLLREMAALLESRYERIVLYGMEILAENAWEELEPRLGRLLAHPSARVRARALGLAAAHRAETARPHLAALVADPDPAVRVQALTARAALEGIDPVGSLEEFLDADDADLRAAVIEGLVVQAGPASEARVYKLLQERQRRGLVSDRLAIARALGQRGSSTLHDLLDPLLADPDLEVRRAALRSAGAAQRRLHVPVLIEALGQRPTEEAARAGLAALGDRVVGTLGDYLTDGSVPLDLRVVIPRALGDIPTQESVNALFRPRDRADVLLDYRVLKAANRIRSSGAAVRFPRGRVTEALQQDSAHYLFAYVHYRSCPIGSGAASAERLLCIALNERMDQALNRAFRRLALLYPPQEILDAYQGVTSEDARRRGNALEYLENALAPEHAALVLPLVDDIGDDERLQLAARQGFRLGTLDESLEALLRQDDPWLRACALYVAGARRERRLLPLVESNLDTLDQMVSETASWARLAIVG